LCFSFTFFLFHFGVGGCHLHFFLFLFASLGCVWNRLIFQWLGIKICPKSCFNHSINLFSSISMQTHFSFYTFFNLNANPMVETRLGINFGPSLWEINPFRVCVGWGGDHLHFPLSMLDCWCIAGRLNICSEPSQTLNSMHDVQVNFVKSRHSL
jgi:hypothetical protein